MMTASKPDELIPSRIVQLIEVGGKFIALAAGVAYFLGLLVTNLHLQRFGSNFLGFFTLQYLSAGMWALYPFAVGSTVSLLLFTDSLRWSKRQHRLRRWADNAVRLSAMAVFLFALGFVPLFAMQVELRSFADFGSWIGVFAASAWLTNPRGWRRKNPDVSILTQTQRPLAAGAYGVFGLWMLASYCQLFTIPYSTIPARWGGGAPSSVHVLISGGIDRALVRSFGFPADSTGIAARLLLLTDDVVLIAPPNSDRAVLVRRSSLDLLGQDARRR